MNSAGNITSQRHAFAWGTYSLQLAVAFVLIRGYTSPRSLIDMITDPGAIAWGLTYILAGILGLGALIFGPRTAFPGAWLWTEVVACALMSITNGIYVWALIRSNIRRAIERGEPINDYTVMQTGLTVVMMLGLAVFGILRIKQAVGDLRGASATSGG